jgi:predicted small metal-binding protein
MQYEVTCECGWHAAGAREALVAQVIEHGRQVHQMDVTEEQALAQIKPAAS